MEKVESHKSFGGDLIVYDHASAACKTTMRFAVYVPPQAQDATVPVLWYLSGLTCNWSNVNEKSGIHRYAAEHGIMVIFPDTSPRGEDVANDPEYDLGQGAGFYLDATQEPWAPHFNMETYVTQELPALIAANFPNADMRRQGITGHSMGGHGALTLHLRHPGMYKSVSAFSPIVAPTQVPWGQKAFAAYLGDDQTKWAEHDACALIAKSGQDVPILVDQGDADPFFESQLQTQRFVDVCKQAGKSATINIRPGYDHSYWFVSSFMEDHMAHHAELLKNG